MTRNYYLFENELKGLFNSNSRQGRPKAGRASSQSSVGSESPALSTLSLDSLVAPDTPIQFDIISPVSEEYSGQAKSAAQGRFVTLPVP